MKCVAAAIAAMLLLLGCLATGAVARPAIPHTAPSVLVAATDRDTAGERDSYRRKAMDDMREWQRKLHDLGATAAAKGRAANDAAEKDLHKAWTDAKAASEHLRVASAAGWSRARAAYEKAARDLAVAWHGVRGEEK